LKESLGKTYVSKDWLMMNSDMYFPENQQVEEAGKGIFLVDSNGVTDYRRTWYSRVPYVNLALLQGLQRSGYGDERDSEERDYADSLGARCRYFTYGFEEKDQEYLVLRFIAHNRDLLPKSAAWYVPEHLGGVGLPAVGRLGPSWMDRCVSGGICGGCIPKPPVCKLKVRGMALQSSRLFSKLTRESHERFGTIDYSVGGEDLVENYFWLHLISGYFDVSELREKKREKTIEAMHFDRLDRYWQKFSEFTENHRPGQFDPLHPNPKEFIRARVVGTGCW
jgi:hypothetical protein